MKSMKSRLPFLASLLPALAQAEEDFLLPDEGPGTADLVKYANEILHYTPLLVGLFCGVACLTLHYIACRKAARTWTGTSRGWWTYWGVPALVAATLYVVLCGAILAYGFLSSAEFGGHVVAHFGAGSVLLWFFAGTSLALSPLLVRGIAK